MRKNNGYYIVRNDKKKNKKFTYLKAIITLLIIVFVLFAGFVAYSFLQDYDFDFKSAFMNLFYDSEEKGEIEESEVITKGKVNFFVTLTEDKQKSVYVFLMVQADMYNDIFKVSSFPPELRVSNGETLEEVFLSSGINRAIQIVNKDLDIEIDRYIITESKNFIKTANLLGKLTVDLEEDILYDGDDFSISFKSGNIELTGANIIQLMRYPNWSAGRLRQYDFQSEITGEMLSQYINSRNFDKGEALFNELVNLSDTNISIADYKSSEANLKEISENELMKTRVVKTEGSFTNSDSSESDEFILKNKSEIKKEFKK